MKHTLWVVGDSTLSSFTDKYYYPRYGYGTMLQEYLTDDIVVRNLALSGRSSKSFITEPEYQQLLEGMAEGDFLIIGFGHNDEKTEEARYTDANGDYTQEGSFAHSLYTYYVKPAQQAGTQVILCTPIVRRTPDGIWNPTLLHVTTDTAQFAGGDYAQAIRDFGAQCGLLVVDMTQITKDYYDTLGADKTVYLHAWPSNKAISVDNTHTNIWGARVNAFFVLRQVKELSVAGIAECITIAKGDEVPAKDVYLQSNPDYIPTVFSSDLPNSTLWKDANMWKGTVFGDIGELTKEQMTQHFTLEELEDGQIHIAVKDNAGKISAVSDGIAMYYQKVPVGKHFIFSAKMKINKYFSNNQVSFGLMVRDDLYIDQQTADVLGDYVAAAPLQLTNREKAWNCFARKSNVLTQGGTCTRAYNPGDEVQLVIESTQDGYACTFGDEQTITGGFDFQLTSIDPEHVYVGMFVSRNADVTFSDVNLEYK